MEHPLVLGKRISTGPDEFYIEEVQAPNNNMVWTNNKQSAFSLQEGQSELDRDAALQALDENNAYRMLEEYEFIFNSTAISSTETPCICFKAPMDGRLTIVRRWVDKYLLVYIPFNYRNWLFSSSINEPDFERLHGNAWVFGKYNTRDDDSTEPLSRNDVELMIKNILVAWLLSEDPTPIIVLEDNNSREILTLSDISEFYSVPEAERISKAWEIANLAAIDRSADLFLPDSRIFLPIKAGAIVPVLLINTDPSGVNTPNLKMGVVDIHYSDETSSGIDSKWIYFDTDSILKSLSFTPDLFGVGGRSNHINAWYPLESLYPNRIKKIIHGNFTLFNPPQTITSSSLTKISNSVLFENNYDPINLFTNVGSATAWSVRNLDQNLQPLTTSDSSFRRLGVGETYLLNPSPDNDISFLNIKAELDGESYEIAIPKAGIFSGLRQHIVRILREEYDLWHDPGLVETDPGISDRLGDYWEYGPTWPRRARPSNANLQSATWQEAHYWSAAFISWVMRQAGTALGLENSELQSFFRYAENHTAYLYWAKEGRENRDINRTYWLYDKDDLNDDEGFPLTIVPGDIIGKNRDGGNIRYDTLRSSGKSHSDLVLEVLPDRLILIGGNVLQNVDQKIVLLTDGKIDPNLRYFVGQETVARISVPRSHSRSQSQFFAIMKIRLTR